MSKKPVSELEGAELDYWVARAIRLPGIVKHPNGLWYSYNHDLSGYGELPLYSTHWACGGPIFSKNFSVIAGMNPVLDMWPTGDDLLPFLMRAFVESEFGEYVEVEAA
jgi:hypothetical protein